MTMSGKRLNSSDKPIRKSALNSVVIALKAATIIAYVAVFVLLFTVPLSDSWPFILIFASIVITALTVPLHAINTANLREMHFLKAFLLSYMTVNIFVFFVMLFFITPPLLVWGIYACALIIVAFFILAFNQKARD